MLSWFPDTRRLYSEVPNDDVDNDSDEARRCLGLAVERDDPRACKETVRVLFTLHTVDVRSKNDVKNILNVCVCVYIYSEIFLYNKKKIPNKKKLRIPAHNEPDAKGLEAMGLHLL